MRLLPYLILLILLNISASSCEFSGSTDNSIAAVDEIETVKEVPVPQVNIGEVVVRFNEITDARALGAVQTSLHNLSEQSMKLHIAYSLTDGQGNIQRFKTQEQELEAGEYLSKTKLIEVQNPIRWSPDNPEDYQIAVSVIVDDTQVDDHEIQSSIRLIENTDTAFNKQGSDINCMPQGHSITR